MTDLRVLSINELSDEFERRIPRIWCGIYRRFYKDPGDYHTSKLPAATMVGALDAAIRLGDKAGCTALNICGCCSALWKVDFPHYYVGRELVSAMYHSRPPKNMTWGELKLPRPAMIFMLPRGFLKHPVGGEVGFLGFAKVEHGKLYTLPFPNAPVIQPSVDKYSIFWSCHNDEGFPIFDSTLRYDTQLQPNPEWISEQNAEYRSLDQLLPHQIGMNADEQEFATLASGLVSRLIMIMHARPQLEEAGYNTGKHLKRGEEVWTPHFIGRKYMIKRTCVAGEPTGITLREHIRDGHFRRVWYAPGRSEFKIEWIACYVAGGDPGNRKLKI